MTREEFAVFAETIGAAYGQECPVKTKAQAKIWYEMLADIPIEIATVALKKHIATSVYPPKIADITKSVTEVTMPQQMSSLEAWSLVYKAICNSTYKAEEEFEKLPEACKRAVGSPANLREMASMDIDTVQSVEQSHFIRNYDAAVSRINQDRQIPAKVMTLISAAMGRQQLEDYQSKALPQPEIQQPEAHVNVEELSDGLREIYLRHVAKEQRCQEA